MIVEFLSVWWELQIHLPKKRDELRPSPCVHPVLILTREPVTLNDLFAVPPYGSVSNCKVESCTEP